MTDTMSETPVIIKKNELKTEPVDRPRSPESNCAICLEEFHNKSFTNSCLHQFCYSCIKEWSRIKPECPLCKQRFHTIIYNVRSLDDFDEYHVNTNSNIEFDETVFINFAFPSSPYSSIRNTLDFINLRQGMVDTYSPPISATSSMLYIREVNGLVRSTDTIHPTALPSENDLRTPSSLGLSRYRRDIYRRGRWVRPSQSSRVRHSSPTFYRSNPAQTHRLGTWLNRELFVLLDISIDPQVLLSEILHLITLYPIRSRHFREAIRPALGDRTEHFVHEFYNFAISPQDMVSYDIMAEYGPRDAHLLRLAREESSDSDSDVEVVNYLGNPGVPSAIDLTSLTKPITLPTTSGIIEISDSSNSDSEIEIVGLIKPVTPETIVIESTDEDGTEEIRPEVVERLFNNINDTDIKPTPEQRYSFSSHSGCSATLNYDGSTSSKDSNSTSSASSTSSSSVTLSSSLSSVSDSDYGRKRVSQKKKKRTLKCDINKQHQKKARIESSSSDEDFHAIKLSKRPRKSVIVKAENSNQFDTCSDSD